LKIASLNPELFKYRLIFKALCIAFLLSCSFQLFSQREENSLLPGRHFVRVDSIRITGNKITREKIILREIVFDTGEYLDQEKLDTLIVLSKENLMNTLLFNFVEISSGFSGSDSAGVVVKVHVTERWYIWPTPILKISDRNFNVWWETKDFSRLSYGFNIDWQNFTGRKDHLIFKFQWGYDRVVQAQYLIPYLNRKKTLGMSCGAGFSRQREEAYQTVNNKQEFYKDPETFAVQHVYAFGQFLVRRNIYNFHQFELRFDQQQFSDSLVGRNINYTIDNANNVRYLSFSYVFKSDHRDFKSYPLKGYYIDFGIIKHGLWNFSSNTLNTFQILATFRKYWQLHPRIYFATGLNGQVSAGLQPYFILGGIGYDRDMVRSYEYYLVDAQHFGILKNNFKFALIPTRVKKISFIKSDRFGKIFYALYLNVFFDAGYGIYNQDFGKETNDLQNSILFGYGAGLDFVTYYDVVVRLEFSVNKKGETGFFLHFRAPI
jgi:outer membrane protein assembly factor BamA